MPSRKRVLIAALTAAAVVLLAYYARRRRRIARLAAAAGFSADPGAPRQRAMAAELAAALDRVLRQGELAQEALLRYEELAAGEESSPLASIPSDVQGHEPELRQYLRDVAGPLAECREGLRRGLHEYPRVYHALYPTNWGKVEWSLTGPARSIQQGVELTVPRNPFPPDSPEVITAAACVSMSQAGTAMIHMANGLGDVRRAVHRLGVSLDLE